MRDINWGRVFLGGGVSGLIYNLGGMTSALLMGLPQSFARFGEESDT